jgi:ComF family protein
MRRRLRPIVRRLLGSRCLLCAGSSHDELCDGCSADIPAIAAPACAQCALASPGGSPCAACLRDPPPWGEVVAACAYAHPVDALVKALKYGGRLECAPALAELLARALASHRAPDLVVPLPLSPARLRSRGFNQSLEIARALPPWLSERVDDAVLERIRDAGPQAALPLHGSAANVRGAFRAVRALAGLRVAVLDDVMTTGSTLREAAAALRDAGALEVSAWVVARALRAD